MGAPGLAFETWDPTSKGHLYAVPFGSRTLAQALGGSTQPSRSVNSDNCANPKAWSLPSASGAMRHVQLFSGMAGVFMRASEPNTSTSCTGIMQTSATDVEAARIKAQTTSCGAGLRYERT